MVPHAGFKLRMDCSELIDLYKTGHLLIYNC